MPGFVLGVETCCVCGDPLPAEEKVHTERPIPDSSMFVGCTLTAEVHAGCVTRNITLDIARAKADLRDRLDETGLTALIGPEHFHPTVQDAVDRVREGQLP